MATDDLIIFNVATAEAVAPSLRRRLAFDKVIQQHGLIPAVDKESNDEMSATCIGLGVDSGSCLAPHSLRRPGL